MKVVVDTNLFISFLLGRNLQKLFELLQSEKIVLLVSGQLFDELIKVLDSSKFKAVFSENDVANLVAILKIKGSWLEPKIEINDCRDTDDNFILELAVAGDADYIVTGDKDLLTLNPFKGIKIIKPREFEELLK